MPAHLPAPKVVQFTMSGDYGDDSNVANVFHVEYVTPGPYAPADLLSAAHTFYDDWSGAMKDLVGTAFTWSHCIAKDLSVADGAVATYVPTATQSGTVGTAPAVANAALVISWKEDISYRGGHPRTYLAAFPNADILDPQHVMVAYAEAVQTAANGFLATIAAEDGWGIEGTGTLAVVHYSLAKTILDPPHVGVIRTALVNNRIDSQRRRLGS
jgi:hypothetical protein